MNHFVPNVVLPEKWCYWMAAAIDFEGSLEFNKKPLHQRGVWKAKMRVTNTNEEILHLVYAIVGGGSLGKIKRYSNAHKPAYYLCVGSKLLRTLLPQIVDILVVKRQQATLLMEALNLTRIPWQKRSSWQETRLEVIYWEMKLLNQRGRV